MDSTYRRLLTYAYNVLGSYEDAKDLVQDALEKYIGVDKSRIENETNYLIKMVVNASINFKNRKNKQTGYGVWLPEPIATEKTDLKIIREQTAGYTLLVLMEKLTAKERAVFILKEGFDYSHDEIAQLLEIEVENSRQLLTRAKKALQHQSFKRAFIPDQVLTKYIQAVAEADVKNLEQLLMDDIRLMADGGQKIKVIKDVEMGKEASAKLLQYVYALFLQDAHYFITTVNHQPAICFHKNDRLISCQIFEINEDQKICQVYSMVAPEKLRSIKME